MILAAIMFLACPCFLFAVDLNMSGVIAYPVPFNPDKKALIIEDKGNTITTTVDRMEVEIYDINGDTVYKRTVSSAESLTWSGYNSRGKMVKPGMYIIRVRIEDQSGAHGEKIIRILVNY